MKRKKLPIKLKSLPKSKAIIKRRRKRKDDIDDHEDEVHEHGVIRMQDDHYDEFEELQEISHASGTLHHIHEDDEPCEPDEDEEEDEDIEEEKTEQEEEPEECETLTARGSKNKHYVKPEEFEQLIKTYYKGGDLTNDLCDCVYKIANRLSYRPNFVNYSFREEMVGDAIERMVFALSNKVYKYNPKKIGKNGKKGNAFLYFTKIAENAFINRIKVESRNREAITKYQEDVYRNLLQQGIDIDQGGNNYSE